MRIFVTGGTGYIGSAVVGALVAAGHQVSGLAREGREALLQQLGATAVAGELQHPEAWVEQAAAQDAVIHMGIDYSAAADIEAPLLRQLLAALQAAGGDRGLVYTSGVWVLGNTGETPAGENAPTANAAAAVTWRPQHESLVLEAATERLVAAVLRPGMVYGGKAGLVTPFFVQAVEQGAPSVVGDGQNRWSLVHRDDLAQLYRRIIEQRAIGIFHGVDEHPLPVAEIAALASRAAGGTGSVRTVPLENARRLYGSMADALCMDQRVIAPHARVLGWKPRHASFAGSAAAAWREVQD